MDWRKGMTRVKMCQSQMASRGEITKVCLSPFNFSLWQSCHDLSPVWSFSLFACRVSMNKQLCFSGSEDKPQVGLSSPCCLPNCGACPWGYTGSLEPGRVSKEPEPYSCSVAREAGNSLLALLAFCLNF